MDYFSFNADTLPQIHAESNSFLHSLAASLNAAEFRGSEARKPDGVFA
jgi:hypothetical protein